MIMDYGQVADGPLDFLTSSFAQAASMQISLLFKKILKIKKNIKIKKFL